MPDLQEDMFFFPSSSDKSLLGFTHMPTAEKKSLGIVYCHPFAEEKNCSHYITTAAARDFAKGGYPVLRFDYYGCGDSEGDFQDVTLEQWCDDITDAAQVLKKRANVDRVVLWGLRLGAALALLSAQHNQFDGIILWQPVLDLRGYMTQFLRNQVGSNITNNDNNISVKSLVADLEHGKTVHVFGYPLSPEMYKSFLEMELILWNQLQCPFLITSISKMETAPAALSRVVENISDSNNVELAHIKEEPFWDRYERWEASRLATRTIEWLDQIAE